MEQKFKPAALDPVAACVVAEQAFLRALGADGKAPSTAHAEIADGLLTLSGQYVSKSKKIDRKGDIIGQPEQAQILGEALAYHLKD